jgi:hypothetical protein
MAGGALQGAEGRLLRIGLVHSALLTGLLGLAGMILAW